MVNLIYTNDLQSSAFYYEDILNKYYPEGAKSGKDEFIEGAIPHLFNISEYDIYPNEAKQIIHSHQLVPIQENIIYAGYAKCILYHSPKGYYILMSDFNEPSRAGKTNIGIGTAYIYSDKETFENEYREIQNWQKNIDSSRRGTHIYQKLSDKYGEDFPTYTFKEIN